MIRQLASLVRRAFGAGANAEASADASAAEPQPHGRSNSLHPDWIGAMPACPDCIPYDLLYAASRPPHPRPDAVDYIEESGKSKFR